MFIKYSNSFDGIWHDSRGEKFRDDVTNWLHGRMRLLDHAITTRIIISCCPSLVPINERRQLTHFHEGSLTRYVTRLRIPRWFIVAQGVYYLLQKKR
ncbi:hypothetical protein K443DRAFT_356256 [Laccaria amethystina LaAM-08-1]|uniref:Uncharacterized protein n=1 Tax=Laccaria amethystina LaAM-08-1 TaxID=1095629 RepID=A0A0C9XA58_9AGAR|nr:hypothetical protein K443DRAFT_356256 [Laccaria amethystina LaAM-08-1]